MLSNPQYIFKFCHLSHDIVYGYPLSNVSKLDHSFYVLALSSSSPLILKKHRLSHFVDLDVFKRSENDNDNVLSERSAL